MQFTLIYQGDLPPNGSARDKWRIRRHLEPQMRRLWGVPPFDTIAQYKDPACQGTDMYVGKRVDGVEYIPLISASIFLMAELRIRIFSSSMPGGLLHCGDIDNRLKTLLDALSIPNQQQSIPNLTAESDNKCIAFWKMIASSLA